MTPRRLAVVVTFALIVALSACAGGSTGSNASSAPSQGSLLSVTASSGTWRPSDDVYALALDDVSPVTVEFSDRPQRNTSTMSTAGLAERWGQLFAGSNPNAAVVASDGTKESTLVVELSSPAYDAEARTLSFDARPLAGAPSGGLAHFSDRVTKTIPATFAPASLFIDNAAPLTSTTLPAPTTAPRPVAACATPPAAPLNGTPVTMVLRNDSALPDDEVFVTLTGTTAAGYTSWGANPSDVVNGSVPLSCLPRDPEDPKGHAYTFEIGEGLASGLVWISLGEPVPTGAGGLPDVQPSFDTTDYRFANVELAYPGQGDMTNVDQFSFGVDLAVKQAGSKSVSASTSYSETTCGIVNALESAATAAGGEWSQIKVTDEKGGFVRVVSPKQRASQPAESNGVANPFRQGWPSMADYLASMAKKTTTVQGLFTPGLGSPSFGQTGWYDYTGTFDEWGNLSLSGKIGSPVGGGPGIGGTPGAELSMRAATEDIDGGGHVIGDNGIVTGIYDENSQYAVGGVNRNGWTNGSADPAAPNDVYNSIYRDFITAFSYGYWGGNVGASTGGFWGTFVPPAAPSGGQPAFAAARRSPDGFAAWNIWSEVMSGFSTNYSIPYGEDYGSGAPDRPSPLLDVPAGGRWEMTIKGDGPGGCLNGL